MNKKPIIGKYLEKHPAVAEYKFLFACCRSAFAGGTVQYPYNVRGKELLEIIQHHKLIPQIYPILKDHCENVPDHVLQEFKRLFKNHNLHILNLTGELVRLSKIFATQNISWLAIKGPALAVQLYGDVAARQAGDLDILVRKNDLERAVNLLQQAGYVPVMDQTKFTARQINFIRKYYRDISFRHSIKNVPVELHWLLIADRQSLLNREIFYSGQELVFVGNREIPVLPAILNLVYICLHGSLHGWYRLFWLWDFATIIKDITSEQAEQIIEQTKKYKIENALNQAIALSGYIFSIDLSGPLKQLPIPKGITRLATRFIFTRNMMSLKNSPFRVLYKMKIFTVRFFFSHYCRRSVTFLLRKYKGVK